MKNTVADSSANQLASNAETPQSFPKLMKATAIFYLLMIPFSLYQRAWATLCVSIGLLLMLLGGKEQQMSRLVKVIWLIAIFGFIIASYILVFRSLFSRGR